MRYANKISSEAHREVSRAPAGSGWVGRAALLRVGQQGSIEKDELRAPPGFSAVPASSKCRVRPDTR